MTGMLTGDENNDRLRLCAARRTKISSFDPALLTVRAAYPTPPFPPFPHPAIEGTSWRPWGRLDLNRVGRLPGDKPRPAAPDPHHWSPYL